MIKRISVYIWNQHQMYFSPQFLAVLIALVAAIIIVALPVHADTSPMFLIEINRLI